MSDTPRSPLERKTSRRAAALRRADPQRRSKRPSPPLTSPDPVFAVLEVDTRMVLSAYELLDEANANAPCIAAASGFALLVVYSDERRQVASFSSHPVLGWQLCHGGESPLPITFNCQVRYHRMCDLAIRNPDGSVTGFEGRKFANAETWLADRKRVLLKEERS
jgi:hypothetical protein